MSVAESNASKKRKERSAITLEKKVEIIKKREENTKLSHQDLANQYHVDRSTISNILRDKDKYLQLYNTTPHAQQRVRVQKGQFHIIDEAVYKLFLEFRSQNVPVSQDILKTKALSIYERLKDGGVEFPSTFNASNGWVFGFQQRFGISSKTISGESESADKAAVESGRRTRKFKPFVIGKSARPLCMKTTNMSKLPVHYSNNKTAWMTETKWENWLKWLDSQVNQPTILLADN
ncbi:9337_t:CDS:2, partial [Cetraspora pellucida]